MSCKITERSQKVLHLIDKLKTDDNNNNNNDDNDNNKDIWKNLPNIDSQMIVLAPSKVKKLVKVIYTSAAKLERIIYHIGSDRLI